MLELKIDSSNKTIQAKVLLKGERDAIDIRIGHYELRTEGKRGIALSNIETSKPWINAIVETIGPVVVVPFKYVSLLSFFF